jgi:hypothetical protein
MSAVLSPPIKVAPYLFQIEWTGTAPFRIFDYYKYEHIETNTSDTQRLFISPYADQCSPIQILDATEGDLDGVTYPAIGRAQWRGQAGAVRYDIDNGLAVLNSTPEDGRGYYDYVFARSGLAASDGSIMDFTQIDGNGDTVAIMNITAYDTEGNSVLINLPAMSAVSVPLMFEYGLTYDSGTNTITVGVV